MTDAQRIVREAKYGVAFDLETTSANVGNCEITCLSIGNEKEAISFRVGGEVWEYVKGVLANPDIMKIGQNAIEFDCPVLERYGVIVK